MTCDPLVASPGLQATLALLMRQRQELMQLERETQVLSRAPWPPPDPFGPLSSCDCGSQSSGEGGLRLPPES